MTPAGDGAGARVAVANRSVHALHAALGVEGAAVDQPAPAYATVDFFVHCLGVAPPDLRLRLDGDTEAVAVPSPPTDAAPPALWITTASTGRAALEALLGAVGPAIELRVVAPADLPPLGSALRLAPLVLVGVADVAALQPAERAALADAAAFGATVVVAAGEGAGAADTLEALADVRLGAPAPPGPALGAALPRVTSRRILSAGPLATVRVEADGAPVLVERPLGLGRVRVLATPLTDLDAGPLARAALQYDTAALDGVLAWLAGAPPLADARGAALGWAPWIWVGALLLLGLVARRWPRLAAGLGGAALLGAAVAPAVDAAARPDAARVLFVPTGGGDAVAAVSLDVSLRGGGVRGLAAPAGAAFEALAPGTACLVSTPADARWILPGAPGDRRRLVYFARAAPGAPVGEDEGALPGWPPGPLAGAALRPVAVPAVLAAGAPAQGWLARPVAEAPAPPLRLGAPPPTP